MISGQILNIQFVVASKIDQVWWMDIDSLFSVRSRFQTSTLAVLLSLKEFSGNCKVLVLSALDGKESRWRQLTHFTPYRWSDTNREGKKMGIPNLTEFQRYDRTGLELELWFLWCLGIPGGGLAPLPCWRWCSAGDCTIPPSPPSPSRRVTPSNPVSIVHLISRRLMVAVSVWCWWSCDDVVLTISTSCVYRAQLVVGSG